MEKTQVVVADGTKELIIREGKAQEIRDPREIKLSGTIQAPGAFMEKRREQYKPENVNVTFSRSKMEIVLTCNDNNHFQDIISGKLTINEDLQAFNINTTKTTSIKDLMSFLKMQRFFFASAEECIKIVGSLQKFTASVKAQIEQAADTRGNKTDHYDVEVESNLVLSFTLKMPVFKGFEAKKFQVEVCFDVRDRQVAVWLESVELREIMISERDAIIDAELAHFKDYVVIEQ